MTAGLIAWEHLPDELRRELIDIVGSIKDWNTMQALRHAARTVDRLALLQELEQQTKAAQNAQAPTAGAPAGSR